MWGGCTNYESKIRTSTLLGMHWWELKWCWEQECWDFAAWWTWWLKHRLCQWWDACRAVHVLPPADDCVRAVQTTTRLSSNRSKNKTQSADLGTLVLLLLCNFWACISDHTSCKQGGAPDLLEYDPRGLHDAPPYVIGAQLTWPLCMDREARSPAF